MSIPPDQKWTSAEIKDDYERGFIDGMQEQMKRSVDKAVNRLARREWVGLTDEEINNVKHVYDWSAAWTLDDFARVIEAKLKEKNT